MSSKLERIRALSEAELREAVLIPLLARMGFRAPSIYHGQREFGKDIIAFDIDRLDKRWYLAVVAKTGDLTGAVSGPRSLREAVYQVEQCFSVPYRDLHGMTQVTMDQVWICTSGKVVPGAADSVFEHLEKQNLNKLVRVLGGADLVRLLDEFYPTFWDEKETLDDLRVQRDSAFDLIRRLLSSLGAEPREISGLLDTMGPSRDLPIVTLDGSRRITRVSPYRIALESVDSISPIFSDQCGWIRMQYLTTRQKVSDALLSLEEVLSKYDRVAGTKNPESFLKEFERLLAEEHPFYRATYGAAADALGEIGYLSDGLKDIGAFERALEASSLLDWAHRAFRAILESEPLIQPVLATASDEGKLVVYWTEHDSDPVLRPEFARPSQGDARFVTEMSVMQPWHPPFSGEEKRRRITSDKVLDAAGAALRRNLEKEIRFDSWDWQQ